MLISNLQHFDFTAQNKVLSKHLLSVVSLDLARLSRHQTTRVVKIDRAGNILKSEEERGEDNYSDQDNETEEFCTPGQDMADVVQSFIEENSRYFEDVLLDENVVVGKLKEKNYQVVVRGSARSASGG